MNKLISRNPIQRFKEGRKIVKFQNSGRFVRAGRSTMGFPVWADTQTGNLYTSDIAGRRDPNRDFGTSDWKQWTNEGQTLTYHSLSRNGVIKGSDYIRKTSTPTVSTTNVTNSSNTSEMSDRAAAKARIAQSNRNQVPANQNKGGKKTVNKTNARDTATPVVKSTPTSFMGQGIQQGWRGTAGDISGVTEAQRQQLINSGRFTMDDFKNAGTLQTALNRELSGLGKGTISVDNKWGTQSQKALQTALVGLPAMHPTSLSENSAALQMTPKPITYTVNNLAGTTGNTSVLGGTYTPGVSVNGVSTIQNSIQNMNLPTYNRRGVRDYLRAKGFNPYSFNGAQRRALRMTLNNTGDSIDSAIVQGMGLFKKGGLISRNPVKQFKVNFRKEAL